MTVYIRERNTEGELFGIIVNDERSPDRVVTLTAERGTLLKSDTGAPKVFMINGSRQQVTRNSNRLSILYFDNYAMEFVDPSNNINPRNRDVRERSLSELLSATEEEVGPGDYRQFRVEAHQRLVSPLYHFTFALLSSAFLLCGEFKRRGQGERLVLAITTMVCIQAAALGVSDLANPPSEVSSIDLPDADYTGFDKRLGVVCAKLMQVVSAYSVFLKGETDVAQNSLRHFACCLHLRHDRGRTGGFGK